MTSVDDEPPLPKGTKPLWHQVAGHIHGEGKTKLGFLQLEDGVLLKPVQSPPRGMRELQFYQRVFDPACTCPVLLRLRSFIPRYLGTFFSEDAPGTDITDVTYFRMEDITRKFRHPCIADIKIGPVTYDPEATPEKIRREKSKYPPLEEVGFQILGMRVYQLDSGYVKYDKIYGRGLKAEEVLDKGISVFFDGGRGLRLDALRMLLDRLCSLRHWFHTQRLLAFYASSLLLVYEGDLCPACSRSCARPANGFTQDAALSGKTHTQNGDDGARCQDCRREGCSHLCQAEHLCDLRVIDFAHVFDTSKIDQNFLDGLNSLIHKFELLLDANVSHTN